MQLQYQSLCSSTVGEIKVIASIITCRFWPLYLECPGNLFNLWNPKFQIELSYSRMTQSFLLLPVKRKLVSYVTVTEINIWVHAVPCGVSEMLIHFSVIIDWILKLTLFELASVHSVHLFSWYFHRNLANVEEIGMCSYINHVITMTTLYIQQVCFHL